MGCCACRSVTCCCCDSQTGAALAGIINLVSGTVGLVTLYFILTGLNDEMNHLQKSPPSTDVEQQLDQLAERYWVFLLSYAVPAAVAFLLGFTVILASVKQNEYLLLISILINGLLIIAVFAIAVILFVLSFPSSLFIPLCVLGGVESYFILVLLSFRAVAMDFKSVDIIGDIHQYME